MGNNSYFRRGQSTYNCISCGKHTRDTGHGVQDMCEHCVEVGGIENEHLDGYLTKEEAQAQIDALRKRNNRGPDDKPLPTVKKDIDSSRPPVVLFDSQSNPEVQERNNTMTTNTKTEKKTSAAKKPTDPKKALRTGVCLFDGKTPTKGLFAPGNDAKMHSAILTAFKEDKVFRANKRQMEYLKLTGWFKGELTKAVKLR